MSDARPEQSRQSEQSEQSRLPKKSTPHQSEREEAPDAEGKEGAPDAEAAGNPPHPGRRWIRLGEWPRSRVRTAAVLCVLAPLAALAPFTWLQVSTLDQRATPGTAQAKPVAIVLGAGLRDDGTPTTLLARRLDVAARLYRAEKVDAVLVSGDNSVDDYNEPDAMRSYLVAAGVPRAKTAADYAGFSTWESCTRAQRIFGVETATVITQNFHLPRAVKLCSRAGIDTQGVGDDGSQVQPITAAYGYVREVPASFPAAFEAVVRLDPQFLGPREPGVREALAVPR